MHDPPPGFGIYVHVPWCRVRCPYCSFNVFVDAEAPYVAWAERIAADWGAERPAFDGHAHSVFFGGGTPSLAPADAIASVLARLPLAPGAEVTLEANPGTITADHLAGMAAVGVNRVSVGVQTFHPPFARLLNRGHTVSQARELVGLVAAAGLRSWSVDVIFGLPGQALADFEIDLAAVLELSPPHVSLYGLELHPGTPLTRAVESGRITMPPEEAWRAQYDLAVERLEQAGWERYEISNFARSGHRAVHNEAVWRGGHYAGLGPGAHGFRPDGTRTFQAPDLSEWLSGKPPALERPHPRSIAVDLVLTTLRHAEGLSLELLGTRAGHTIDRRPIAPLEQAGLLVLEEGHWRLATPGYPLADGLVARVCDALVPLPAPG